MDLSCCIKQSECLSLLSREICIIRIEKFVANSVCGLRIIENKNDSQHKKKANACFSPLAKQFSQIIVCQLTTRATTEYLTLLINIRFEWPLFFWFSLIKNFRQFFPAHFKTKNRFEIQFSAASLIIKIGSVSCVWGIVRQFD